MLWSAFTIGLLGSMHCIGMCGPIALSLPWQAGSKWRATANVLIYNLGRVLTYSLLGIIIGFLGKGLFLAGMQRQLSLGIGILLLLIAIFSINVESKLLRISAVAQLNSWVKRQMGKLLRSQSSSALFGIGMLNGLLPCGLVYMAIVGAVATGNIWQGAAYMALFGMGTIPLMMATAMAGQFISLKWRNRMRKLIPAFLILFALLFLARGFNFQVPADMRFLDGFQEVPMCH